MTLFFFLAIYIICFTIICLNIVTKRSAYQSGLSMQDWSIHLTENGFLPYLHVYDVPQGEPHQKNG